MSALQNELMKTTNELSDDSIKIVLDYVRTFIVPFDRTIKQPANKAGDKMKALKELEEIVAGYSPIIDPEKEIMEARDAKYGVIG